LKGYAEYSYISASADIPAYRRLTLATRHPAIQRSRWACAACFHFTQSSTTITPLRAYDVALMNDSAEARAARQTETVPTLREPGVTIGVASASAGRSNPSGSVRQHLRRINQSSQHIPWPFVARSFGSHAAVHKHRISGFARHWLGQTHVHCLQGTIANRCDGFRPVSLHSCCIHTRNVRLCKACLRRRIAKDSETLVTDCSSIGTIRAPPLLYYFVPFPPAHSQLSITLRRSYMAQHPPVCLTLTS